MKSRLFFSILFVWVTFAGEEWTEVAYFQRKEAKMRIHIYDPPIVMEWLKIPNNIPQEIAGKLEAIAAQPFFMHESFESWKKYSTKNRTEILEATPAKFREQDITLEDAKKQSPGYRFQNILYSVDFLVNEQTYSMVVETIGETPLLHFPEDIDLLEQSKEMIAKELKFEDGRWKNHYSSSDPFKAMERFNDLDRLRAVMEAGYAYHSIDHAGIWPFAPSDVLKHDSVRDPYPGETLFRYPLKKPPIKKPAAPDLAVKTPSAVNPPAFSEEQDSAPLSESCAVP